MGVVDPTGKPILAVPPYDDGSEETLAKALAGVDLGRCMHASDLELKEQRRRDEEQRAAAKAEKKAEKQRRSAEENGRKALAKAAKDVTA